MSKQDGRGRRVSDPGVDDPRSSILHVDMDAFFVEVETLDDPSLRGRPVVIGTRDGRSVVSSASYEARASGVQSAMPVARALSLCPRAIVVPPRHERYREESAKVMDLFRDVTPHVEPLGIDEAFLDVAGARRLFGPPAAVGRHVRERVRAELGLPCSVGAASTKFVAKMASGMAKPDGLLLVPHDETVAFLRPLPVRALWGVGAKTAEQLNGRAIRTIADVADTPPDVLVRIVGRAAAAKLAALARGVDPRPVEPPRDERSIGHETTFADDISDESELARVLLGLADRVGSRARAAGVAGHTVSIKVRFADFTTITRSRRLREPTAVTSRIAAQARELLGAAELRGRAVRLLGVRIEELAEDGGSGSQLWDPDEDWRGAERATDALRARFGSAAVSRASLLRGRESPPEE